MKKVTHKERVERVREFSGKNKIFIVIAIILLILLFSGNFNHSVRQKNTTDNTSVSSVESEAETENDNTPHWRFYWSDFIVFSVCVGAYAAIKIKKSVKAREKLQ